MRPFVALLCTAAALACTAASAQSCPAGEGRLRDKEPCIPSHLVNYLVCLAASGGGKLEFSSKVDNTNANNVEVTVNGKGSGIILKGEGSGTVKTYNVSRVVEDLKQKLDPALTANCKELARPMSAVPLPLPMAGSGTDRAEVSLSPQPRALSAQLSATAITDISDGGWMILKLLANGAECAPEVRVYKNPTAERKHTTRLSCVVAVKANERYTFKADATRNHNADANGTELSVHYWR